MILQLRNKPTHAARRRAMRAGAVAAIFVVHAGLLAYLAARHSPTIHELAHLPAGICHWQFGMFELYRVNPPLPRVVRTGLAVPRNALRTFAAQLVTRKNFGNDR